MKVERIEIRNYRLLKSFSMSLEDELSLVVGKNNTGKTSLLTVMSKFLKSSERENFSFDDFNIDLMEEVKNKVEGAEIVENAYRPLGIELNVIIRYDDSDNLSNISRIMTDLTPEHTFINLSFTYSMDYGAYVRLRSDYKAFKKKEDAKKLADDKYVQRDILTFLKQNQHSYFKEYRKSLSCDKDIGQSDGLISIDLDNEKISLKNIINFKYISAKRDVTNREVNTTLSTQTSKIYDKTEASDEQNTQIEEFKAKLVETDTKLSGIYAELFKETVTKVAKFGGIKDGESKIIIESTLQHKELLKGNTTVMYKHGDHSFPEYHNGLGYMNLISIIFEIEILLQEFKRTKSEQPADINLLFIEEPEAHTHPQMQYVFINNIKGLLKQGIKRPEGTWKLQYMVSTHSSHIVSESDFNDIRYLKKESEKSVIAKELRLLEKAYGDAGQDDSYRFLKQYLTLNKAELFFADKAIFVEGETERILLPAMMKKLDQEKPENPLLSQNISLIEVGAYSQVFEKFIDFIGVKTLVVTDVDSAEEVPTEDGNGTRRQACPVEKPTATYSTNTALKFFLGTDSLTGLITMNLDQKRVTKKASVAGGERTWTQDDNGLVQIVFQKKEKDNSGTEYHARSFEDAFVHLNPEFLKEPGNQFESLTQKYLKEYRNPTQGLSPYDFADKAVNSKPSFAIEVLLNSKTDSTGNQFSNWLTPEYIKEGLEWLKAG